ncbi:hypothetical protein LIX92_07445 [Faecalibacillus faecis]|nr:hypothetical protein [Faecalibacillus faecis]MCB7489289.1 hypothetical protein [Faecalibacillus faecis]MCG4593049.1 hypothetical protein [Faecalibacillus faecis]
MKCLIIDDDQSCIDMLQMKLKDYYGDVELDIFKNHHTLMNYKKIMICFS